MKTISSEMQLSLGSETTSLCRLWVIQTLNRAPLYFTDHDEDVPFDGKVYISTKSFSASAVQTTINSAAANLEISVLTDDDFISRSDLENGIYDNAKAQLLILDYLATDREPIGVFKGIVLGIDFPVANGANISLSGNFGRAAKNNTEKYSATCRANFGDERCKVDTSLYTEAFTVDTAGRQTFTASELVTGVDNKYKFGTVLWTTGRNAGVATEVANTEAGNGRVNLYFRTPYPIEVGDEGTITQGCQYTLAACIAYNNVPNYRGEPFIPGDVGHG
jgi:uncharacterized phage protein (TIGR02218 family)